MKVLSVEKKLCLCCMEEHEVKTVEIKETNVFKGKEISYMARYDYCEIADEYNEPEEYISRNDISMKNSYRKLMGLLLPSQIKALRTKYGISQSDLAQLLDWGEKTITRYESHQVQDAAHDSILKKIDDDPEWYIELLKASKEKFSESSYVKYLSKAQEIYENEKNEYLKKTIQSSYVKFENQVEYNGGKNLDINKVVDIVRYFANSSKVRVLYKVKLMKMLWYSDALAFKRYEHSLTGLIYKALPMGAVPISHELIIDLNGIKYEEIDFGDGTGYSFVSDGNCNYPNLSADEIDILDTVISVFGDSTKEEIVNSMHNEQAYIETAPYDVIQYKYAKNLSIA